MKSSYALLLSRLKSYPIAGDLVPCQHSLGSRFYELSI